MMMLDTLTSIIKEHDFVGEPVVSFSTPLPFVDNFNSSDYDSLRADE